MPLSEKWVITVSSQYGCSMKCSFCDVPMVGPGINATLNDLSEMVKRGIALYDVPFTKRLNIHYARMGEPTFNPDVIVHAGACLKDDCEQMGLQADTIHPVVSTMMPKKNKELEHFLTEWMNLKNSYYNGEAGLQLSINSTDDEQRDEMFGGEALSLMNIAYMCDRLPKPVGRKITLNFAINDHTIVNGHRLRLLFNPKHFMVKLTPIHDTSMAKVNNIMTSDGYDSYYPYKKIEDECKKFGFDVLVFIPSHEEDESKITCGNAIISEIDSVIK
jgi:23S rRNA (adenine2503-C2)-methyltransferase